MTKVRNGAELVPSKQLCMLIVVTILIAASIVSAFKRSSVRVHILNYKIQFICWLATDGDARKS